MNAETLARIAEPFFTTKGANGTGLGLWVSRDLLEKHHATMRIKSRNRPGRSGTVFSIFLPLKATDRPENGVTTDQRDVWSVVSQAAQGSS